MRGWFITHLSGSNHGQQPRSASLCGSHHGSSDPTVKQFGKLNPHTEKKKKKTKRSPFLSSYLSLQLSELADWSQKHQHWVGRNAAEPQWGHSLQLLQSDAVSARVQNHIPETICMEGWLLNLAWALKEKLVKLYPWSTHNLNWRKQALASMASQRFALQWAKSTISSKAQFCWHNCIYGITRDFAWTATAVWKKKTQTKHTFHQYPWPM